MLKNYVYGLLIDKKHGEVLISSYQPTWQDSRQTNVDGIGGHNDILTESPDLAVANYVKAFAGVDIPAEQWEPFVEISGHWGTAKYYRNFTLDDQIINVISQTGNRPVEVVDIEYFPYKHANPVLSWVLPLAVFTNARYMRMIAVEQ